MNLASRADTIVRGPDGVLYRHLSGEWRPFFEEKSEVKVELPLSPLGAAFSADHAAARSTVDPGDHLAARSTIDPGDHPAMRSTIDPGDHLAARSTIDPGDHLAARSMIDPQL